MPPTISPDVNPADQAVYITKILWSIVKDFYSLTAATPETPGYSSPNLGSKKEVTTMMQRDRDIIRRCVGDQLQEEDILYVLSSSERLMRVKIQKQSLEEGPIFWYSEIDESPPMTPESTNSLRVSSGKQIVRLPSLNSVELGKNLPPDTPKFPEQNEQIDEEEQGPEDMSIEENDGYDRDKESNPFSEEFMESDSAEIDGAQLDEGANSHRSEKPEQPLSQRKFRLRLKGAGSGSTQKNKTITFDQGSNQVHSGEINDSVGSGSYQRRLHGRAPSLWTAGNKNINGEGSEGESTPGEVNDKPPMPAKPEDVNSWRHSKFSGKITSGFDMKIEHKKSRIPPHSSGLEQHHISGLPKYSSLNLKPYIQAIDDSAKLGSGPSIAKDPSVKEEETARSIPTFEIEELEPDEPETPDSV